MSQHDPTNAPDPELSATSPTPRTRTSGEMRSAAPALCLLCVNLLLIALLVSSSSWPTLFHLPQPQQIVPPALPTPTTTDAAGLQPADAPPIQATTEATIQATTPAHASATATLSVKQPSPTIAPPTPTMAPPTPRPTPSNGGG